MGWRDCPHIWIDPGRVSGAVSAARMRYRAASEAALTDDPDEADE